MKFKDILFIVALLAACILPSCKKDKDDTTSKDYLSGNLTFDMPAFVTKGSTFTLVPAGIKNPSTGNVGYYWYTSWDSTKDTTKTETGPGDGAFTVSVPDSIGSYNIYCIAYATDYYTSSGSSSFYVVDPQINTTITDSGLSYSDERMDDSRDSKSYFVTTVGGKKWFKNNLYYSGSGVSYAFSPAMDALIGKYYTWEEAVSACPQGWHLPSDAEFAQLANSAQGGSSHQAGATFEGAAGDLMVNAKFIQNRMWTFWPEVNITNKSGFCALPGGYVLDRGSDDNQKFQGMNNYAVFWTSDSDGDSALYRYIYVKQNDVMLGKGDKTSFRASVRCVKD
ncbi:MAG: hypothetical protein J6Z47_06930 [Bacteroidales bacterium]|nr:hypothetical protein [Bacteroidales bacterium]